MEHPYSPDRELIPCCVHLRTKTQYYQPDEMQAGPGFIKVTTTGAYWCNRSCTPAGPDNAASTPQACQPGRGCYESAES